MPTDPTLTDEDAALLVQLSKRLATTANVETGTKLTKLQVTRALRNAVYAAHVPMLSLRELSAVADALMVDHVLYQRKA